MRTLHRLSDKTLAKYQQIVESGGKLTPRQKRALEGHALITNSQVVEALLRPDNAECRIEHSGSRAGEPPALTGKSPPLWWGEQSREYKIIELPRPSIENDQGTSLLSEIEIELNKAKKEGWEVVMQANRSAFSDDGTMLLLRREKKADES